MDEKYNGNDQTGANVFPSAPYPDNTNPYGGYNPAQPYNNAGNQNYDGAGVNGTYSSTPGTNSYGTAPGYNGYGSTLGTNPYGTAPGYNGYGSTPGTNSYGTAPGYNGYGSTTGTNSYGTVPDNNAYGSTTGTNSYGTAPDNNAYGSTPGTNSYGTAPDNNAYSSTPGTNSYGTAPVNNAYSSAPGNNTFGSSQNAAPYGGSFTNNEPGYDPNAPLYDPAADAYDPNAPLYHPEPSYAAAGAMTQTKPKVNLTIPIVIILAIVLGVVLFMVNSQKRDIKSFIETREGKMEMSSMTKAADDHSGEYEINAYANENAQLVLEFKYKQFIDLSYVEKAEMERVMDDYVKKNMSQVTKAIDEMKDRYHVEDFSVVYKFINSNGNLLYQCEIFSSEHNAPALSSAAASSAAA